MSRWEPDARGRLERAALDLFVEHGFDDVTVPEITARAGLTTRTFFRHFADKREVLFADADRMPALATRLVLNAPTELGPAEVVTQGLTELASVGFEGRLHQLVQRQGIVDGHDGLRERELHKMETLVNAITDAFRQRGVDELTAAVIAETSVGIVKIALRRWMESHGSEQLPVLVARSLQTLRDVFA